VKDLVVVVTLVLAFALLVTTQVAIVYGLAFRAPRWRAVAALFAPLAVYWAWREGMRVRMVVWCVALGLYVVATFLAHA
jgi:hypothetical protein